MTVLSLTEARVQELALGSGIYRDAQVKGLLVICHKTTRTYACQGDVRRNGRHVRTVRVKIDRCDRVTLREARRKARTLMSLIQSGVDPTQGPEESGITLKQVMDGYGEGRRLSPRTLDGYRYNVDKYLRPIRGRAVADIGRQEVRELYDSVKRRSGEATAASAMRTLRALVNEAMRIDETITRNPVAAIRVPQTKRRSVEPLDLAGWWSATAGLSPRRRDLHRMFMLSGLRRTSILTIRRQDVDLAEGVVRVQHMKSGRPFVLALSPFMTDLLRARMEDDAPMRSPWLWPSVAGSASGHVEEPREDGLPGPHEYRHHYRTQAIAAGVPYAETALLLDQRLPGASGGYVHPAHLVEHLRTYQRMVTDHILRLAVP